MSGNSNCLGNVYYHYYYYRHHYHHCNYSEYQNERLKSITLKQLNGCNIFSGESV